MRRPVGRGDSVPEGATRRPLLNRTVCPGSPPLKIRSRWAGTSPRHPTAGLPLAATLCSRKGEEVGRLVQLGADDGHSIYGNGPGPESPHGIALRLGTQVRGPKVNSRGT